MNTLRVTIIQVPTLWENANRNRDQIEAIITGDQFPKTDLIVLPEMWTTGFSMNTTHLAETMHGESVHWMSDIATQLNVALTGSLIIRDGDHFYNRLVFAKEDGSLDYYDKKHCFALAGEHHYFTPGNKKVIIEWRNWKICPMVCYDLRFPVWSRNIEDYDLLVYCAQFPAKRNHAWRSLLVARAIENTCYVVGVNGIGTDGNGIIYSGDSMVIDYEGQHLLDLRDQQGHLTTELSKEKLQVFRRAYPFLKDRDQFNIL